MQLYVYVCMFKVGGGHVWRLISAPRAVGGASSQAATPWDIFTCKGYICAAFKRLAAGSFSVGGIYKKTFDLNRTPPPS